MERALLVAVVSTVFLTATAARMLPMFAALTLLPLPVAKVECQNAPCFDGVHGAPHFDGIDGAPPPCGDFVRVLLL